MTDSRTPHMIALATLDEYLKIARKVEKEREEELYKLRKKLEVLAAGEKRELHSPSKIPQPQVEVVGVHAVTGRDSVWREVPEMLRMAKSARANAHTVHTSGTRVGATALSHTDMRTGCDSIQAGCNVEHRFRCHDVHAEVNAISSLCRVLAPGVKDRLGPYWLRAILVVSERNFTPCGGCMDWIMQFGGPGCCVFTCNLLDKDPIRVDDHAVVKMWYAESLMPCYPS